MLKKSLSGAALVAALTFGAPSDARAGCVTMSLDCIGLAWSLDSYWDTLLAIDLCHKLYMECMKQKLLAL